MPNLFSLSAAVDGIESLLSKLTERFNRSRNEDQGSFRAGFSAPYAAAVHDNETALHVEGQAKFLKSVVDDMKSELQGSIESDIHGGLSVRIATERAAVSIMKQAQTLAPVDTGTLRDSAFVESDGGTLIAGTHLTAEQAKELRKFRARENRKYNKG
jgi:hypothetical protein